VRRSLAGFAIAVATASPALGATVESPALTPPSGGYLECIVVNTGEANRTISVDVLGLGATPISANELFVEAGTAASVFFLDGHRCRFAFKGPRKTLRLTVQVNDSLGTPLVALEVR
jgi:hypothetical protein